MSPLANLLSRSKDGQEADASLDVRDLAPRPVLVARVNLLPAEIADAEIFRREQIIRAGALVAAVVIVGVGAFAASQGVTEAQKSVDAAAVRTSELQAEIRTLAEVPLTAATLKTAQTQRAGALGNEVRWSSYLNDLGLQTPPGIQIKTMEVKQNVDPAPAAAAGAAAAPGGVVSATGKPGIASVSFTGITRPGDGLAFFLESLALQKGNIDPYFTEANGAVDDIAQRKVVEYNASVTVDDTAKSGRYTKSGS